MIPLQQSDAAQLAALHGEGFAEGWSEASFVSLLADPHVFGFRVVEGDLLAGFILMRAAAGEAEVLALVVSPGMRARGLGRSLLGQALAAAIVAGAQEAFLEVAEGNTPARRLYEDFGFAEVARRDGYYATTGEDALVLRCQLEEAS